MGTTGDVRTAPPTGTRHPTLPTTAAVATAAGLLASGLLTTMGGSVRWAGCLTPDSAATCAAMHGDAAAAATAAAAPLLAAGWVLLAVTLLGLALTRGLPQGAPALLVVSAVGAGAQAVGVLPALDVSAPGPVGLVLLLGVPALAGAVLMAEGGRSSGAAWWLGLALVLAGAAHSVLGWALPLLWSDSADDPVGLFLVGGVATVAAGALALWGAARSR